MVITQLRDVESVVLKSNGHAVGSNMDNGGPGAEFTSHKKYLFVT